MSGREIALAAEWLRKGECVAIPTETVYGLAANALQPAAVVKIFATKNRPSFDPLIVHVPSQAAVSPFVTAVPAAAERLMAHFWPGPLTLLLPKTSSIPDIVTSGLSRVALRCPAHPMAQALLQQLDFPLAAPSANPFGYISPTTAAHVMDQLAGKITVTVQLNESSNPAAPGMLLSHYAPRKPLWVGELSFQGDSIWFNGALLPMHQRIGLILYSGSLPGKMLHPMVQTTVLSERGQDTEAAQNLFAALRVMDQADVDLIVANWAPNQGLGMAINDRLKRAAAK
ncbi:MAG: threonylcarbamoyl-AMP synthase [Lewinellaceae bacterium]|nr:threonylcarbamoyl-AMP synthase [Lewinellaceae bacterium]